MSEALHYDIETFSECDLKSAGVYKYAEHPSTEMLCMSYCIGTGPVKLWIPHTVDEEQILKPLWSRIAAKRDEWTMRAFELRKQGDEVGAEKAEQMAKKYENVEILCRSEVPAEISAHIAGAA